MLQFKKLLSVLLGVTLIGLSMGLPLSVSAAVTYIEPGFAEDMSKNISGINGGTYTGLTATYNVTKTYQHMLMTHGLVEFIALAKGEGNPGFDHTNLKVQYTQNRNMLDLTFEMLNYGPWGVDCIYINITPTDAAKQLRSSATVKGSLYFEKNASGTDYRSQPVPFTFTLTNQTAPTPDPDPGSDSDSDSNPTQAPDPTQTPGFQPEYIEPGFAHDMSGSLAAINAGAFEGVTTKLKVREDTTYAYMLMTHGLIEFFKCQRPECGGSCEVAKTYDHKDLKVKYTQNGEFIDMSFSKSVYGAWGVDCIYLNIDFTDAGKKSPENSSVKGVLYYEKTVDNVVHRTGDIPFEFILTGQSGIIPGTSSEDNESTQNEITPTETASEIDTTSEKEQSQQNNSSENSNSIKSNPIKENYDISSDVESYVNMLLQGEKPNPIRRKLYADKKYGMQPLMKNELIAKLPCSVDGSDCSVIKGCTIDNIKYRLTENTDSLTLTFSEDAGIIKMEIVPTDRITKENLPQTVKGYIYFEKEGGGMVHQSEKIFFEIDLLKSPAPVLLIVSIIAGTLILVAAVGVLVKRKKTPASSEKV